MEHTPPPRRSGGVEDTRNYGDTAECAVCHTGLDRPPHPEGLDLCGEHTKEDYERMLDEMGERKQKRQEEWARQQDHVDER